MGRVVADDLFDQELSRALDSAGADAREQRQAFRCDIGIELGIARTSKGDLRNDDVSPTRRATPPQDDRGVKTLRSATQSSEMPTRFLERGGFVEPFASA